MPIKIVELHHHGIRIGTTPSELETARRFYTDVLGLQADPERPTIPGVPGFWIFVGNDRHTASIHLISAEGMSPIALSEREDPTLPHVALAVEDIHETRRELERQGIRFWQRQGGVVENSDHVVWAAHFGSLVDIRPS